MSVTSPQPPFAGPPPSGVQPRLQYQLQRKNAVAQYTQPAAVMSDAGTLLVSGEYESGAFTMPQGANRITLQAAYKALSGTFRMWLETDSGSTVANLTLGRTVKVSIPVGRTMVVKAAGGTNDTLSSYTIFASYERP